MCNARNIPRFSKDSKGFLPVAIICGVSIANDYLSKIGQYAIAIPTVLLFN